MTTGRRWTYWPMRAEIWRAIQRSDWSTRAESVSGAIDAFRVITDAGENLNARRLILSYGVVDLMPDVTGFADA